RPEACPAAVIYREVKRAIKNLDIDLSRVPESFLSTDRTSLKWPSERTIQRAIAERISKEDKARTQKGDRLADRDCVPTGRGVWTTRILERVELDHTPLDIMVIDPATGLPLGRPY